MGRGQMTRQLREEAGCRGRAPGAPSPRTVTCRRGHGGEAWFGATGIGDLGTAEAGAVRGAQRGRRCVRHMRTRRVSTAATVLGGRKLGQPKWLREESGRIT